MCVRFFSTQTAVKKEHVRICSLAAAVLGEFWAMWLSTSLTQLGLVSAGFLCPFFSPYALFQNAGTIYFMWRRAVLLRSQYFSSTLALWAFSKQYIKILKRVRIWVAVSCFSEANEARSIPNSIDIRQDLGCQVLLWLSKMALSK